jgi:hypothetical protein
MEKFSELLTGTTAIGATSCASPISPLKICRTASGVPVAILAVLKR